MACMKPAPDKWPCELQDDAAVNEGDHPVRDVQAIINLWRACVKLCKHVPDPFLVPEHHVCTPHPKPLLPACSQAPCQVAGRAAKRPEAQRDVGFVAEGSPSRDLRMQQRVRGVHTPLQYQADLLIQDVAMWVDTRPWRERGRRSFARVRVHKWATTPVDQMAVASAILTCEAPAVLPRHFEICRRGAADTCEAHDHVLGAWEAWCCREGNLVVHRVA
mmetsp:Transcript_75814/g.190712  ORF Transcript_75814/g.190712 Transcript_75814/m.190712 type:complete len:218 (+) Transcript_75814:493-1146(+)